MGTLMVYTAFGGQRVTVACQQAAGASSQGRTQSQGTPPTFSFNIRPATLGEVLDAFHATTGLAFELANDGIRDLSSPGVSGTFTNEQALKRLLAGTGVSYKFTSASSVTLTLASLQQSITVDATQLEEQVASAKYTEPILDTPQTVNVVPEKLMSEQNTTTLRDALRNVAGVSLAAGEGGAQGDNLTIRGFTARNDIFLDGIRDFGSYYRDTFNQQEVQVLQGPAAVTFGRGTTGGIVNEVSKTPQPTSFISGNATAGSDLTRRIALDINKPIPALGSGAAFRLNVMGDDNKVAERDVAEYRRYGFAPSLALGLNTSTRVVFSYFHQSEDDTPDYGIPWLFNRPAPVDRTNYYGFKNANFLRTNDDIVTVKVEHDLNDHVTLRNVIRYGHEARNAQITEAQIPAGTTPATPLDTIQVNRNQINVDSVETMLDDQFDATLRFRTGGLGHTLVTGVEAIRETSDPTRNTISGVPTTSLLNPDPSQPYAGTAKPNTNVDVTAFTIGAYALDTISLGRKFDLLLGARWDRFDADYNQSVPPVSAFEQIVNLPSWRSALVYKPKANGSIYFAAGNSYNPSAETLSLSAANANTPPESSMTYELGSKWDLGKFSLNGAVFSTEKTNAREPDPNNPLQNVLGGNQRVTGFQASVSGYLTSRWELLANYAYLNSTVVSSVFYPGSIGFPLANTPKNTFNFWTTYKLPWRSLLLGGGGNFVDSRTASSTVPIDPTSGLLKQVPSYWVFNAMANYPLNERTSLQLNVYNLANKYYYDQIHPAHIVPGAGISALGGINFRF